MTAMPDHQLRAIEQRVKKDADDLSFLLDRIINNAVPLQYVNWQVMLDQIQMLRGNADTLIAEIRRLKEGK